MPEPRITIVVTQRERFSGSRESLRLLWVMQSPVLKQLPDQVRTACADPRLVGIQQRLGVGSILLRRVAFDFFLRFSVLSSVHVDDDYGLLRERRDDMARRDSREKTL